MTPTQALSEALAHFGAGRLREAEAVCKRILKANPENPDALHLLGALALQRGEHGRAVDLIARAIEQHQANAAYHINLGEAYRGIGDLDRAIQCLERALEINPERAEALCALGNVYAAKGDSDSAIANFDLALARKPDFAQAHYNKGNTFAERGEIDAAIDAYRQAVSHNPSFSDGHFNLGNALQGRGDLIDAVDAYEHALRLAPYFAYGWYNMGNALRKLGRLEAARKIYERALEVDASLAGAHLHLGTIAKLQGRYDAALAAFDRAIALEPDFSLAHSEKAHVQLLRGNAHDAEAGYRHALDLDPNFAWAYMGLSTVLAESGRLAEAQKASLEVVRRRRVFEWPFLGRESVGRVLVLKGVEAAHFRIDPDDRIAATGGMNNADFFFDRTRFHQASFYMDEYDPATDARGLPACDVIFNLISDVDLVPKLQNAAAAIAASAQVPVINAPEIVARSQRHQNYQAFRDLEGVVFPATLRLEERPESKSRITERLDEAEISLPVLVRRTGTHTGDSLEKADDIDLLVSYFDRHREGPYYLVAFHDCFDARGGYVKMRMYFIDGQLYPSQYFVSDEWNVHVGSRIVKMMADNEWMDTSAKQFHADPQHFLGKEAFNALTSLYTRLPMDYFGVDFTQLDDGQIFVFEANATMRIPYLHTDELDPVPYRKPSIEEITRALSAMLEKRITGG